MNWDARIILPRLFCTSSQITKNIILYNVHRIVVILCYQSDVVFHIESKDIFIFAMQMLAGIVPCSYSFSILKNIIIIILLLMLITPLHVHNYFLIITVYKVCIRLSRHLHPRQKIFTVLIRSSLPIHTLRHVLLC